MTRLLSLSGKQLLYLCRGVLLSPTSNFLYFQTTLPRYTGAPGMNLESVVSVVISLGMEGTFCGGQRADGPGHIQFTVLKECEVGLQSAVQLHIVEEIQILFVLGILLRPKLIVQEAKNHHTPGTEAPLQLVLLSVVLDPCFRSTVTSSMSSTCLSGSPGSQLPTHLWGAWTAARAILS